MSTRGARGPAGARKFLTDEEKQNMPKVTKLLLARILSYLKPYWLQFAFVFAAIVASSFLGLLPAYFSGRIVDTINTRDIPLMTLVNYLSLAFGTALLSQSITIIERMVNSWISQRIIHDMKSEMYRHLQHMQHSFFTTHKHGDIVTRMTSDIEGINTVVTGTLSNLVNNAAVVLTTLAALFRLNWILAVFGITVMPLLFLPNRFVGRKKWQLLTERQTKKDRMNTHIDETLSVSGSHLVKLFARENAEYEFFRSISSEVTDLAIREQRVGKWFSALLGMFSSLSSQIV
ncbi:MAG: ABC transporter ATP-binding protein, partial [Eubacteriaceae bacterium]|nr:ABC transporter ATP-binding protein [Eubacteriaceae bacterium]